MKFSRILFTITLFHLNCLTADSQTEQKQLFFKDPRAGSFTIFGDIPTAYNTGIPDISIPLFTLESHGYKIPITLKYHLALVKPPYDYTNVATGWVLDAGGVINQEFKSLDDLRGNQPPTFRTDLPSFASDPADKNYLTMVYNKGYDTERDLFSYTLPNGGGKFVVDKSGTSGIFNVKPLTDPMMKGVINVVPSPVSYTFQNIQLTDDNGNKYNFNETEGFSLHAASYLLNEIKAPNDVPLFTFEYSALSGTT